MQWQGSQRSVSNYISASRITRVEGNEKEQGISLNFFPRIVGNEGEAVPSENRLHSRNLPFCEFKRLHSDMCHCEILTNHVLFLVLSHWLLSLFTDCSAFEHGLLFLTLVIRNTRPVKECSCDLQLGNQGYKICIHSICRCALKYIGVVLANFKAVSDLEILFIFLQEATRWARALP